jgi:hypothetical protein
MYLPVQNPAPAMAAGVRERSCSAEPPNACGYTLAKMTPEDIKPINVQ